MALEYRPANRGLTEVLDKLIREHFPELNQVRVEAVFCWERDEKTGIKWPPKRQGRQIWGRARVMSGHAAWLATPDDEREDEPKKFFLIEVSLPTWEDLEDRPRDREALLYHELTHCEVRHDSEGNRKLAICPHDLEEFVSTVQRYGLWREDVQRFFKAGTKQMSLLELMDRQAEDDSALLDAVYIPIEGKRVRVTRGDLRRWWQMLEEQSGIGEPRTTTANVAAAAEDFVMPPEAISANELALHRALHFGEAAIQSWERLVQQGATDEEIAQTLGQVFTGGSVTTDGVRFSTRGGQQPKFWARPEAKGKPTYEGKRLIEKTRALLGIAAK